MQSCATWVVTPTPASPSQTTGEGHTRFDAAVGMAPIVVTIAK